MSESRGLVGPILTQYEPETSDEKVRRYLQSEEDAFLKLQAQRRRSHQRYLDAPLGRQREHEWDNYPAQEARPQWDYDIEASSTTDVVVPLPLRRANVSTSLLYSPEASPEGFRGVRPRGMYSAGASSSASGSAKLAGEFGAFHIGEIPQPSSPVSPGDVRFSWDFSDGGEQSASLRASREGLVNSIELAAAPVQAGSIAPADGLLITRINRSSRTETSEGDSQGQSFRLTYSDSATAGTPPKKKLIAGTHVTLPGVISIDELKGREEEERESYEHLLESREPAPYSAAPRTSAESASSGLFQGRSAGSTRSAGSATVGQESNPVLRRFTRNRGSGDSVMEALIAQLVNAKDAATSRNMAERVLLFQASALALQFSGLAQKEAAKQPHNSGFGLLNISGAFVERELDLVKCLVRVQLHFAELLPSKSKMDQERWPSPSLVACIGEGPGCLGLGLLLMFAWLDPALEVELDTFGTTEDMETVVDAVSLEGVRSFAKGDLMDLIQAPQQLKSYKVLILSYVVVEAMRNRKANDWALFWRDLYRCTADDVLVIVCDQFVESDDFLPPQYVQSPGWRCALLEGTSGGSGDNSEPPAYVAWKEAISAVE